MIDVDLLLTWGATFKKVTSGDCIFQEGTQCNFYYQLVSGSVRWININEDGKEFLQGLIGPNECFGELPLFDGGTYAATAIANENSVVIRLHQSTFHQLISENSSIHFAFSKLLTQRLRFKFFLLKELAYHDPEHRITALMNYLKASQKNICCECNQIKLTRQQIADMTGLRVETVIRTIRHMHEQGKLVINKGKVYLASMTEIIQRHCRA